MSGQGYDGDIPFRYDRRLGPVLFQPYAEEAARRIASLAPSHVLEVAAGSGVLTRELRSRLPISARLTATDLSEDMLAIARAKFEEGEPVSFAIVDACSLPYPDGAFDAVVCQFGYMFFADKPKAVREAARALRPGGRYYLSVWDSEENNPYVSEALAVLRSFFPHDPPEWIREPSSCAAIDPIQKRLAASGFESVRVSVVRFLREFDALSFAHGIVYGSPVFGEIAVRGGVDFRTVAHRYAEALTSKVGPTLPIQAIVFEAEKPLR